MNSIELYHPWTKERSTVEVTLITRTYVSIRWGQSGIYDLNLLKNVLTARSVKARNKASCLWQAVDIRAVREGVRIYLAKEDLKETVREESIAHHASMPHQVRKV